MSGCLLCLSLYAVSAKRMNGLRGEPNMSNNRNSGCHNGFYLRANAAATFQLPQSCSVTLLLFSPTVTVIWVGSS